MSSLSLNEITALFRFFHAATYRIVGWLMASEVPVLIHAFTLAPLHR